MKHITLLVFFFSIVIFSQSKEKNIDSLFLNNTKEYEEVTYAHLNKSIFIQGEAVQGDANILNPSDKVPKGSS